MDIKKATIAFGLMAAVYASAAISYTPVTEGATDAAKKLYNFLAVNYGVKTVSGIMTGEVNSSEFKKLADVDSFYIRTGKYPALVGFDYLFATGKEASKEWNKDYTRMAVNSAKDLWNKGGIPAFTWHWKDPSKAEEAFYATAGSAGKDEFGNQKPFTTYDFTQGFSNPNCTSNCTWNKESNVYKQLVADIDVIADYFLELQTAGVAAIFRPLHEASGGWFWWGLRSGAAFQALYNLVYEEMVNNKGVKNLVWVWNPEYAKDTDWNPGKNYDVISLDIYEAWDYSTKYTAAYGELKTNYGTDKMFAVSENGAIPDLSVMKEKNSVWSWWMPWYQTWSGKFLDQTVNAVWKANMESSCTISLEDMPGWDKYTISENPVASCEVGYALADLDTARPVEVVFPGDTATNAWLRVGLTMPSGIKPDTASKGNIVIAEGSVPDLSSTKKITMKVFNGNKMSGIWFTIAFLSGAPDWAWAQPDGCWVNAGDSTTCTFDLSTTTKDGAVLSGSAYTSFMSNINKFYIEIFAQSFAGSVFFDDITTDGNVVINDFSQKKTYQVEQAANMPIVEIVGTGSTNTAIGAGQLPAVASLTLQGNSLSFTTTRSGNVSLDVFDLQGNRVTSLYKGALSAGTHQFSLSGMARGSYLVRAKGAGLSATKRIVIK